MGKKKSCIVVLEEEKKIPWDTRIGREKLSLKESIINNESLNLGLLFVYNFDLCKSICACHHAAEKL